MSRPPIPVYDERGDLFAPSVTEATRLLGLKHASALTRGEYLRQYLDGYQLRRRPGYAGQWGGARPRTLRPAPLCTVCGERAARSTAHPGWCSRCNDRARDRQRSKRRVA